MEYEFRDSDTFLLKYRQLQNRALSLIKNEIVQTMKQCAAQIQQYVKVKSAQEVGDGPLGEFRQGLERDGLLL